MALFTSATLTRFTQEGVNEFATKRPYLVERQSVASVDGTKNYSLEAATLGIRRVTWKGIKIDPLPHRLMRDFEVNQTTKGIPLYYVFNNVNFPSISFFPIPNITIAAATVNMFGSAINTSIIIEAYMIPTTTVQHPSFLHTRMDTAYTNLKRAEIQTKTKDKTARDYLRNRWDFMMVWADDILTEIETPSRIVDGGTVRRINQIPTPRLPSTFGVGVDI